MQNWTVICCWFSCTLETHQCKTSSKCRSYAHLHQKERWPLHRKMETSISWKHHWKRANPIYHRKWQLDEANSYHDYTAVLLAQLSEEWRQVDRSAQLPQAYLDLAGEELVCIIFKARLESFFRFIPHIQVLIQVATWLTRARYSNCQT